MEAWQILAFSCVCVCECVCVHLREGQTVGNYLSCLSRFCDCLHTCRGGRLLVVAGNDHRRPFALVLEVWPE
jgi:hypothetical protein